MLRAAVAAIAIGCATPALAQQSAADLNDRIRALETDIRALKRQVLPSGRQRLIEPEVDTLAGPTPEQQAAQAQASALGDISTRLNGIQSGQQRLTAQVEELANRQRLADETLLKIRAELDARLIPPVISDAPAPFAPGSASSAAVPVLTPPFVPSAPSAATPARPAPAGPTVATAKTAEEAYKLAYAPVEARDWPRAETELKVFLAKYPKHRLASFGRYWLGRTYYAQSRFEDSARTHTANYDADARGERAQESLYWVGQSLVQLDRRPAACQVYDLARRVYSDEMKAELRPQFAAARSKAGCS